MAIRIAGAGLSGLVAAITAARLGEQVQVFESKSRLLASTGPHTEAVRNYGAMDALEELRFFGFDVDPFGEIMRTVRKSEHLENVLEGKAYYLFMRGRAVDTVDQTLYKCALDLGVQFVFGSQAPEDVQIVATGPPIAKFNILGVGYTFSADGSNLDTETVIGLLDNTVAPGGYLVISPGVDYHSIYSVSWTELDYGRLVAMVDRALERPWIKEIIGTSKRTDRIYGRAFFERDPIASAQVREQRYAGEAGGFQDAVAGYGFRYAVITGALAARSAVNRSDYRADLRRVFGSEFEGAFRYRQQLNGATNRDFDALVQALGPRITLEAYRGLRGHLRGP